MDWTKESAMALIRIDEKIGQLLHGEQEPERVIVGTEGGKEGWVRVETAIERIREYEFSISAKATLDVKKVLDDLKTILIMGGNNV